MAAFFSACNREKSTEPLFILQDNTGIVFSNNIQNSAEFNIFSYRNFYNGGGVGIGDINNDGLADVILTANMGGNKLFLNKDNWQFEDISAKAGFEPGKKDWSTGVVMVDINHDGWLDIFICNAGYIDGKKPRCQLFVNNKDLSFTDRAEEYGLTNEGGYTTHAAFFDYDLDGDLDCFIINNSFIPVNTLNYANKRNLRASDWPVAEFLKGGGDHFYRNDNGKFIDISEEAGIYGSLISFGLGVTVGDVNGDHYPDIYVSNDFFERDYLYVNQRNGTFKDELEDRVQHISHSSMGADMADINNDGYPDIFTTDMLPDDDYRLKTTTSFDNIDIHRLKQKSGFYNQYTQNTLQVNNKNGKFMETAFFSGVAASDWSWGGLIFDADNDGLSDIFVCNGIYNDVTNQDFIDFFANDVIQKMVMTGEKEKFDEIVNKMPSVPGPNKFFRNKGGLQFADEGEAAGLDQPSFSNGSAYGDLDNDGDLDLIVNNVNSPVFIYKNESRETRNNNYIGIQLQGEKKNPFAIGSKIIVYRGEQIINRELIPTRGFQSSVDYKQVIGLGAGLADSLLIIWPDKRITRISKPAVNQLHKISIAGAKPYEVAQQSLQPWFEKEEAVFDKHTEDDYIDFYAERNIPVMLSREGPHADTADVNGDGLVDVFIGGAAGQPGILYLQEEYRFTKQSQPVFEKDRGYEDVAVLFFDADNDKDKDLFVGSGGNAQEKGSSLLYHRLYLNDGKGNFTSLPEAFPAYAFNCAAAAATDADNDGDLDLFVASRSVPQNYGVVPESYLYINSGKGKFAVGATIKTGMLTDAAAADMDGDRKNEIIVTGEWMSPKIYSVEKGRLTELNTGLNDYKGWWQSVSVTDLDNDGDADCVFGNAGENCYLKTSKENPVKLWINDFDQNGTQDKIITRRVNKKDVPVFLKRELTEQMPSLKKQNLKFEAYAKKSIYDLFSSASLKTAQQQEINFMSSCIAVNNGKAFFDVQTLPVYTQLSCINAVLCADINNDDKKDLIMGGNQFHFQPQFARLDASYGHVLLNTGTEKSRIKWQWAEPSFTGFEVRGEVRDILLLSAKGDNSLLVLQNDSYPVFFRRMKY
ncbi:MAG: CRTAC1 family protein [Bacteroidetes bacterium]|nr:CRTAC1 family protein [Bacteroidota bacterium]